MRRSDTAPFPTYLLAVTGILVLVPVEGSSRPLLLTGAIALLIWAAFERRTSARIPRSVARALDLLTATSILVFAAAYFALGRTSLITLGHVLVVVQLARAFRRKVRHDLMLLHGVALAQAALAAFLTRHAMYLPVLVLVVILGVVASLRVPMGPMAGAGDLRVFVGRPRGRAGIRARTGALLVPLVLALSVLLTGSGLFVLLPRGGQFRKESGQWERVARDVDDPTDYSRDVEDSGDMIVGFTERVRLGEVGRIKKVPKPAFTVKTSIAGVPARLDERSRYFRGAVLDTFDGRGWSRSIELRTEDKWLVLDGGPGDIPLIEELCQGKVGTRQVVQEYEMEATNSRVLLGLGTVVKMRLSDRLPRVMRRAGGTFAAPRPHRDSFGYLLTSLIPRDNPERPVVAEELGREQKRSYLALPPGLERLVAAAQEHAGGGGPLMKAQRLTEWLQKRCEYTLLFTAEPVGNPIDDFLFESRAGHCEYFATALALLLRAEGVPTRLVAGYRGGLWIEADRSFYYHVTMSDAHAWVEAHVSEYGWVRLDPTPGDDTAVSVPPSRLPGTFDPGDVGDLTDRLISMVRDFGPDERGALLSAAGRGVGFVIREGFGLGREERPYPPPLLVIAAAAAAGFAAFRLIGAFSRGGLAGRRAARERSAKSPPETPFYQEALQALSRDGLVRRSPQSPREFRDIVLHLRGDRARSFALISRAFEEVRYGSRILGAEENRALFIKARRLAESLAEGRAKRQS